MLRVWDRVNNRVYSLPNSPRLGPVFEGIRDVGRYRVIGRPLFTRSLETGSSFDSTPRALDGAAAAIQYGRPTDNLTQSQGDVSQLATAVFDAANESIGASPTKFASN